LLNLLAAAAVGENKMLATMMTQMQQFGQENTPRSNAHRAPHNDDDDDKDNDDGDGAPQ
jgi:hypothetical protein